MCVHLYVWAGEKISATVLKRLHSTLIYGWRRDWQFLFRNDISEMLSISIITQTTADIKCPAFNTTPAGFCLNFKRHVNK